MIKTALDALASVKVYFFAGWQYVGLISSIATFTVLINQYRESGTLPGREIFYALGLMLIVILCTVVIGCVLFHTITKRENNINLRNTPYLVGTLESINKRLEDIERKI